jgi:hypothetical protein
MLELVYCDLGYKPIFVQFIAVKVIEGIRYEFSRKATRNISSKKISMTRDFSLQMCAYDLLLHSI